MSKYRVYELAKEFKTESKVVLNLLERNGLRTRLVGRGTVRQQSVAAGTRIVKGQTVGLTLE